jgi:hypothetical protein
MGVKPRCYGEHLGEHFGNLRTLGELNGNMMGTDWKQKETLSLHTLKKKKTVSAAEPSGHIEPTPTSTL